MRLSLCHWRSATKKLPDSSLQLRRTAAMVPAPRKIYMSVIKERAYSMSSSTRSLLSSHNGPDFESTSLAIRAGSCLKRCGVDTLCSAPEVISHAFLTAWLCPVASSSSVLVGWRRLVYGFETLLLQTLFKPAQTLPRTSESLEPRWLLVLVARESREANGLEGKA